LPHPAGPNGRGAHRSVIARAALYVVNDALGSFLSTLTRWSIRYRCLLVCRKVQNRTSQKVWPRNPRT